MSKGVDGVGGVHGGLRTRQWRVHWIARVEVEAKRIHRSNYSSMVPVAGRCGDEALISEIWFNEADIAGARERTVAMVAATFSS